MYLPLEQEAFHSDGVYTRGGAGRGFRGGVVEQESFHSDGVYTRGGGLGVGVVPGGRAREGVGIVTPEG